jgi:Carboxypeptidase regulatory-like domain
MRGNGMSSKFTRVLLSGVILTLLLITQSAMADNVYATIRGYVTDSTGAILPGVQVTATNTQTGVSATTTSQDNGRYEFLQLPVGSYSVSATKQGFKTYKSTAFQLVVNQVYDLPVSMQVGTVSETVEVKAEAVQVDTTTIQQQTVIGSQQIVDLPLLGRNFTQLEQLAPGVMSSSDRFGTFAVNGSQTQQSSYLVNGTDTNDIALNTPGILPSPDAIQEFNLITSTINPEYGRNSGGIVNALIKNGTNSFHGNAFDFYRDTFLNSRNFFTIGPHQPVFHQNVLGGTFGGPIFKDKTFFFLSYQGTFNATGATQTDTVLSAAQRGGFFPDIATSTNTSPIPLVGEDGITHPAGTAFNVLFPTGHIPAADFNSISKNLLNTFVPLPNAAANQFSFSPFNTAKTHQGIARVDHNLTSSDLLWGVAIFQQNSSTQGLPFTGATLPGFESFSTAAIKNFTISENHTFNSSTLNELRVGYFRLNFDAVEPQKPVLPSAFGFTGITPQNTKGAGLPTIAIPGFFTLGFSDNGPQPRKDQNYQITDNFSKIVGRHSLKFGFDARRFQVDNPFFFENNGHFDFGATGAFSTGDALADFLLGFPDDFAQNSGGAINARAYEYYAYAQDLWKIRNNLTLTLGAGYQIDTPYQNRQFGGLAYNCIIPGQQSKVFPTAPVDLNFPGDNNCTNSGTSIKYGHIGPRIGFAWSPNWGPVSGGGTGKFSVRGAFGVYFNRFEEETALQNLGAPPFGVGTAGAGDFGGSPAFATPFSDISGGGSEANKFPFIPPTPGSPVDFTFFEPMDLNTNDPNLSTPYAMNFNLGIQREFAGNTVFSVGYVGSLGRHLYRAYEGDPITAAGQAACAASPSCKNSALARTFQHEIFPQHTLLGQNLTQCPTANGDCFASVGTQFTDGNSNYNALQFNLNKGLTHGLSLITSYTWSHAIDNGSGFENSGFGGNGRVGINILKPALNIGDSGNDARQRLVISYIYVIPSLHHLVNALPDRIFGGWKLTGITTFQTGFPLSLTDSGFRSLSCDAFSFYACPDNGNQVVSNVTTLNPRNSTFAGKPNYFFDPCSFGSTVTGCNLANRVALGTFGNSRRNSLHGPGINNFDFSLQKDTKITERTSFQVGIEAFNLFNHTQFGNPTMRVNSSNFGRITTAAAGRLIQLRAKVSF